MRAVEGYGNLNLQRDSNFQNLSTIERVRWVLIGTKTKDAILLENTHPIERTKRKEKVYTSIKP